MSVRTKTLSVIAIPVFACSAVIANEVVIDFEDLEEGAYGKPYTHMGITYYDLNNVSGVFPDGSEFEPQENDEIIIEDATVFYNDFPGWGSEDKLLTFGTAYIVGDNLSLGRLSTVTMDLPAVADSVSMDVGYYENGPWGGIEFHLDAISNDVVVASDSFVISDLGGRDSVTISELAVSGAEFDQLHLYATFGEEYSLPRLIVDDITINYVSEGALLEVNPEPLVAGEVGAFVVTGATENAATYLAYSLQGMGPTYVPFLNVTVDLQSPKQAGRMKMTDGNGDVQWMLPIPNAARGRDVWVQAAQFENKTNVVATSIQ